MVKEEMRMEHETTIEYVRASLIHPALTLLKSETIKLGYARPEGVPRSGLILPQRDPPPLETTSLSNRSG